MNTTSQNYTMSDEMALGFFDADGSIILGIDQIKNEQTKKKSLFFRVTYFVGQSKSKGDIVKKFAEKFQGNPKEDKYSHGFYFKVSHSSEVGERVRNFMLENHPKNPYRLRDFLISEEIILLLKDKKRSVVDKVRLARLATNSSNLFTQGKTESSFSEYCAYLNATTEEKKEGKRMADSILSTIGSKLESYKQTLKTTKFPDDYVLGAHYGDGSCYVSLSWKPPASGEAQRLRCEPEWAISGADKLYCQAFAYNFKGTTKLVDKKGQYKFVCSGIQKCKKILPLFEGAAWMPSYKHEQFSRWRRAIILLDTQQHFTEQGICELLDLTYDLAEKGGRQHSKEEYLSWGLAWVNNPNRQKRKPKKG